MKRLQDRYNVAISASEITYSQKKKKKNVSQNLVFILAYAEIIFA